MFTNVSPAEFSPEQSAFLNRFTQSLHLISDQAENIILGVKDIHSRHLVGTDATAKILALTHGMDLAGRLDREMPCEGTAQFADSFVAEDRALLAEGNIDKTIKILRVCHYADGLGARVFTKHLLKHHPSCAVLGVVYHAHTIGIDDFLSIIPNYIMEFGAGCSFELRSSLSGGDLSQITEYEHEICFLLLLNWDFGQIADYMNVFRPRPNKPPRVADSIIKSKNRICEKLKLATAKLAGLREALIAAGMQKKMPDSFLRRMIGSRIIG